MRLILLTLLLTSTPLLSLPPEALQPEPREQEADQAALREELARLGEWLLMRERDGLDTSDDEGFGERFDQVLEALGCDSEEALFVALEGAFAELRPQASPLLDVFRDHEAVAATWERLQQLHEALEAYRSSGQRYPLETEGLHALFDAGQSADLARELRSDAWQREIIYWTFGDAAYELRSLGPDGELGTADDLIAGERGLNNAAPANEWSGVSRSVRISEHEVLSGDLRVRMIEVVARKHWDPAQERVDQLPLPAGTRVDVYTDHAESSWVVHAGESGWVHLHVDASTIESWLITGATDVVFRFGVTELKAPIAGMRLPLEWMLDARGAALDGDPARRLESWEDIHARVVAGEAGDAVRGAIDATYLQPLREHARWQAMRVEQLERIDAAGGLDPTTPAARAECLQLQVALAESHLAVGDTRAASLAFGNAARHASDNDDVAALEELIERQLAALEAGQ